VDDLALMLLDSVANGVEIFAKPAVGAFLILASQPAVSGYVSVEDGGELAR
jgi:hypothetical protein